MSRQSAALLWDLLVAQAREGRSITYGDAAVRVGSVARGMGTLLRPIQRYCKDLGLPNICVLVVKADTRKPSSGFYGDLAKDPQQVREYDWSKIPNPFAVRSEA